MQGFDDTCAANLIQQASMIKLSRTSFTSHVQMPERQLSCKRPSAALSRKSLDTKEVFYLDLSQWLFVISTYMFLEFLFQMFDMLHFFQWSYSFSDQVFFAALTFSFPTLDLTYGHLPVCLQPQLSFTHSLTLERHLLCHKQL